MDVNIRYWDGEKNVDQPVSSNTVNLRDKILNAIKHLYMGKSLSMDGPSMNWNVLDLIVSLRIGFFSLHILHGAFQTGIMEPNLDET